MRTQRLLVTTIQQSSNEPTTRRACRQVDPDTVLEANDILYCAGKFLGFLVQTPAHPAAPVWPCMISLAH